MSDINAFIIYSIIEGLFLAIGIFLINYSSKMRNSDRNSSFFEKRTTYYNEIYFKQIEPVIIKLFTKYQLFISVNDNFFDNFYKIIKKINRIPKEKRKEKLPTIKNLFNDAHIFESLPEMTIKSDIIRKLIKSCKNFEKYEKNFKKIEYVGICFIIFLLANLILIITFYFTLDSEISLRIILVIVVIFIIVIGLYMLFIYFKDNRTIIKIIKEFNNETLVDKKVDD